MQKYYDAKEAEKKWQKYWEEQGIYRFDPKSKKPVFSVDTPPPTVSGAMHMGHAFSYSQADMVIRYHWMKGENVFYPFGFDDNGLPTERFVENKIGKKAVEMKRSDFVKICLEETKDAEKELKESWASLGLSCDWNLYYRTIDDWVVKTSQRSFIDIYKKGRAYQKEAPTIWCPECSTAIAQVELEDRELGSMFLDVLFELENGENITISTTRPEFLGACVAVFVHPEDKRYTKLVGKKAKVPLFDYYVPIIADERADPEKGTGIVMCCTFGDQTDMEWYKAYNLPLKIIISPDGKLMSKGYEGMKLKEARKKTIEDLKKAKLLTNEKPIKHVVNVHERCGTEIEFLVTKQWFIKYLDLKDKLLETGKKFNWWPEHMKNRYDGWINGLQWDWCISRQRYYGVPFPVWYCKKCEKVILAEDKDLPVDPLYAQPKKACDCGSKEFTPDKDIMDTWATSSLTPQINLKWKKDDKFFKKMFPMSLRPQAHDIISFWLFNTVVKAVLHENKAPWKNVMIHGWALDSKGKKMSKSKGNVIDPKDMMKKYCADSLRYWAASSKLGEDLWFSEKEFVAGTRLMTKMWNASNFVISQLEDYNPKENKVKKEALELMDRWMLSKLNNLIKENTHAFESYSFNRVRLDTEKFFWQAFCDNYLEIVKHRIYNKQDKTREAAQYTLYTSFMSLLKMFAPIMPHITEEIYNLYFSKAENSKSIHRSEWPKHDKKMIDKTAEEAGDIAVSIISAVRKFKAGSSMSLKAPIEKLVIDCDKKTQDKIKLVENDIKETIAIKNIEFGKAEQKLEGLEIKISIEK